MGLVVTTVSVSIALSREGFVRLVRRNFPHTEAISGAFLILAGGYLVAYWTYVGRALSV